MCWFDPRKGSNPIEETSLENSHKDPVYKTTWISSKTFSEFLTVSTDGKVKYRIGIKNKRNIKFWQVLLWDVRSFTCPKEQIVLEMGQTEQGHNKVKL